MQGRPVLQVNGFFRSATTYTQSAVKLAFPQLDVKHSHLPAFIKKRIENNHLIVACIRNPIDSISSCIILMGQENQPDHVIEGTIKKNISSLSAIKEAKGSIVISNFEDIAKDYQPLLREISNKYGYEYTVPSYEKVIELLPKMQGDEYIRAGRLPRDSSNLKAIALSRLDSPGLRKHLDESLTIYNELI
jgi:hypothetical protein